MNQLRLIKRLVLSGMVLAAGLASGIASAGVILPLTFSGTLWNANTSGCDINCTSQQALPTNPIQNYTNSLAMTFDFTGTPNWYVGSQANNTIGNFFFNGGGTFPSINYFNGNSSSTVLSTSNFQSVSLLKLTFTVPQNYTLDGTITHDDGMSIYNNLNPTTNPIVDSSYPTSAIATPFSLGSGTYNLWYVEANAAPSELKFQNVKAVPEPSDLGMMGLGLMMIGWMGLKIRQKKYHSNSMDA